MLNVHNQKWANSNILQTIILLSCLLGHMCYKNYKFNYDLYTLVGPVL